MKRLAYLSLVAAVAALPALAAAQDHTVDPPEKWEDVPDARLKPPPPPPGTTWPAPPVAAPRAAPPPLRQAVPVPPPAPIIQRVEVVRVPAPATPPPPAAHAAPAAHVPMHHAPAHAGSHHAGHGDKAHRQEKVVVHHGDDRVERVVVRRSPHHARIERGYRVHPHWMDSGYHVRDWDRYRFAEPHRDHRWIRYYDDALLIDRYGTVHDGRYGMDWDEYGDDWDYDDRGIPVYVGDGDYYPDDEDYAYVEEHGGYGYGHGSYGYGYGAGYGYPGYYHGGWGTVTITETTVTTPSTQCCTKAVHAAPKPYKVKRRYKSKPR